MGGGVPFDVGTGGVKERKQYRAGEGGQMGEWEGGGTKCMGARRRVGRRDLRRMGRLLCLPVLCLSTSSMLTARSLGNRTG